MEHNNKLNADCHKALKAIQTNPILAFNGLCTRFKPETAALISVALGVQMFGRSGDGLRGKIGTDPMPIFDDLRSHVGDEAAALMTASLWNMCFGSGGSAPVLY